MTTELVISLASLFIAIVAAIAATYSAITARQAHANVVTAERERRVRELYLLARKIDQTVGDAASVGTRLETAWKAEFSVAGRGGSGILEGMIMEIKDCVQLVLPMQQSARQRIEEGLENLSDEKIAELLVQFDGYLMRAEAVRQDFQSNWHQSKARQIGGT